MCCTRHLQNQTAELQREQPMLICVIFQNHSCVLCARDVLKRCQCVHFSCIMYEHKLRRLLDPYLDLISIWTTRTRCIPEYSVLVKHWVCIVFWTDKEYAFMLLLFLLLFTLNRKSRTNNMRRNVVYWNPNGRSSMISCWTNDMYFCVWKIHH